ncbi:hypothetical protein HPB47_015612 [Ixodes persulcatus]|uniref:Uncharacterized protein n=1 Tax=Ixodes persulcatus TaxID=34615 RepID=A0AC60QT08_IXOPE|nr:hypothetical protein HPB47_015612 [Ixodes persulcatus]
MVTTKEPTDKDIVLAVAGTDHTNDEDCDTPQSCAFPVPTSSQAPDLTHRNFGASEDGEDGRRLKAAAKKAVLCLRKTTARHHGRFWTKVCMKCKNDLPLGEAAAVLSPMVINTPGGRPYRLEDFWDPLKQVGVLSDVAGLGAYQMSHVWLLKLRTPEAKAKLLQAGSLQVKEKTCLPVDPNRRELRVKLHWVSFDAPVDSNTAGLRASRGVRLALKEGVALESLPHQLRVSGGNVLIVVPGRAPICLRCRCTGHIRRDCRAPWCTECRTFGHKARDCVKTFAHAASSKVTEESTELLMDETEAEQAATPATSTASVAAAPEGVAEPSDVNAASVAGAAGRAESPDAPSVEAPRPENTAAGTRDDTAPDLSGESPMEDQDSSASGPAPKRTRDGGGGSPTRRARKSHPPRRRSSEEDGSKPNQTFL